MLGEGRALVNPSNDGILGGAMRRRARCRAGCQSGGAIWGGGTGAPLGGSYLHDKGLNRTQPASYACLEMRGYTLTK